MGEWKSGDLRLEHAFDIRINFKDRWMWGPIHPGGPSHGYTSVLNGTVEGPRLNGKVVGVNSFVISASDMPFGGIKESGFGSESGPEGLESYLVTKAVHIY